MPLTRSKKVTAKRIAKRSHSDRISKKTHKKVLTFNLNDQRRRKASQLVVKKNLEKNSSKAVHLQIPNRTSEEKPDEIMEDATNENAE